MALALILPESDQYHEIDSVNSRTENIDSEIGYREPKAKNQRLRTRDQTRIQRRKPREEENHTHLLVEDLVALVDVRDWLVRVVLLLALLLADTGR